MAGDHQFRLEAFQVFQEPFVAPQVEPVLVDVIREHARAGLIAHPALRVEEGLVARVGHAGPVDHHADQGSEAGVPRHGIQRDGDVLPVDGRPVGDVPAHPDRLVPEAGPVVLHRVLEQIAELLARQDLGPVETLEHGDAVDVVVVEMGDERRVDPVDPEALLQSADPVEDRPSVGYMGLAGLEPGLQVVAIVDGHDLARVAHDEVGLRAGVLRAVQVGQDLFDIILVRVLQRFGDAGLDLLESLQVRLEGRDGAGRVVHRVPQAREQPVRTDREQPVDGVVQVPRAGVVVVVVLQGRQAGRLPGPADHLADESDAPFADCHDVAARAVGHAGRGHDLPRQPRDVPRLVVHQPAVDRHGPDR